MRCHPPESGSFRRSGPSATVCLVRHDRGHQDSFRWRNRSRNATFAEVRAWNLAAAVPLVKVNEAAHSRHPISIIRAFGKWGFDFDETGIMAGWRRRADTERGCGIDGADHQ